MEEDTERSRSWRVLPFLLILLVMVVMVVTGGIALAGVPASLPAGVMASPQQATLTATRTNTPSAATATATPTCLGPWVTKTPYPLSVYGAALASDGTFAYSFGGQSSGSTHAEAYKYNITTNTWTAVMSMTTGPDERMHAEYAPTTNKIYVQGGVNQGTANRIYDVATNTWSSGAALPVSVYGHAHAYYNGKVYLIGGAVGIVASSGVYAYDIASNTWSTLASLPQAEAYMAAAAINGFIYVAGGTTNGSGFINNLYIYNIAANSWSSGPPMSTGASYPGGTAVQGKLWVIGGGQPLNGSALPQAGKDAPDAPDSLSTTQIYDPASNSWSAGPTLNTARSFADATTLNVSGGQTTLIVGGYNSNPARSLTSVEASSVTVGSCATPTPTATAATATPTCLGPWVTKTPYPLSVYAAALASDGTFAYAFGGFTLGGSDHAEAYKYNITTDTWTAVMSMTTGPDERMHAEYAPTTNKIYVQGGFLQGTANRIYDVATNTWSSGAPVPVSVYGHAHAYYNGKVYLIGGAVSGGASTGVYAYDIASNTWSTLASLPQPEFGMAAAAINGFIYVAGGSTGNDFLNNLYIYNIAANSWSSGPPMSTGAFYPGGTAVQGKLWVIGGGQPFNGSALPQAGKGAPDAPDPLSTTQIYDPVSNSWSAGPTLNTARSYADATTLNVPGGQTALIVAGFNLSQGTTLNSVEASSVTSGSCATPAPTRTNTPVQPTPTPASTACPIQFADVPVGSTFYPYIRCLACRGIINGYPDGTFKPNNDITRGQLSKIVSNSAGFHDAQPHQMFEDVPMGSTFQVYIGRLASRGYINGYQCGGAGEPCVPPANLPYFRPNANATRGQISKIVSNAAGFSDPPVGRQFEDVAVGSAFYTYTYRLVSRGVIGGYPCGGAGEPCVPPGNLPYFRPNNNATRGQTSKIVANTFFPDCQTPALK
jgi:N-acetylneuraminic acid mutarotase